MKQILFNKDKTVDSILYDIKPVFHIIRVKFLTVNKNGADRLSCAHLRITIKALDDSNKELSAENNILGLEQFTISNHINPTLEINENIEFTHKPIVRDALHKCKKWEIEVELNNLELDNNESLIVEYMDTTYIQERVIDWENRVKNLIQNIKEWYKDDPSVKIVASQKQKISEGLMQSFNVPSKDIESANIEKNGKMIVFLKPYYLWITGGNGRIDLLTSRGSYMLIDEAEPFQEPIWSLYLQNDTDKKRAFSKELFNQLLD